MNEKRKYTKRDPEYWNNRITGKSLSEASAKPFLHPSVTHPVQDEAVPLEASSASVEDSCGGYSSTPTRRNNAATSTAYFAHLSNIENLPLPFTSGFRRQRGGDIIDIEEACVLCQKAYANVAIFRNAVDMMTEFSATPLRVRGGNKKTRAFITNWLKRARIDSFTNQYFRERFRSGNVFIYELQGSVKESDLKRLGEIAFAKEKAQAARVKKFLIPLKFTILNPSGIAFRLTANTTNFSYMKMLSASEVRALKQRITAADKAIYENLPKEAREQIDKNQVMRDGIYVPLEEELTTCLFYKKQDYEPFAVPFGFPILRDLDFKLELKKVDQALARTVQNVTLLITMGAKKDEGGINKNAMAAMQKLFQSQSVSRVIVSDYTTQGKFLIPEIDKLLDPKKYEVVNKDIIQGLMLTMLDSDSGDKATDQTMKIKFFIERLEEGRTEYINDFLQPRVERMCKELGYEDVPEVYFQEIPLKDENDLARVYTRMMELGILTPDQAIDALRTGNLPAPDELLEAQRVYAEQRKEGLWNPLVAGTPMTTTPEGDAQRKTQLKIADMNKQLKKEAAQEGVKLPTVTPQKGGKGPQPNSAQNGRPTTKAKGSCDEISVAAIKDTTLAMSALYNEVEEKTKKRYGIKKLSMEQKGLANSMADTIFTSYPKSQWSEKMEAFLKGDDSVLANASTTDFFDKVSTYAAKNEIPVDSAAIVIHGLSF